MLFTAKVYAVNRDASTMISLKATTYEAKILAEIFGELNVVAGADCAPLERDLESEANRLLAKYPRDAIQAVFGTVSTESIKTAIKKCAYKKMPAKAIEDTAAGE